MRDKRKTILLSVVAGVSVMLIVVIAWYVLTDDTNLKTEYVEGEAVSQTNDYNDSSKWLSYDEYKAINDELVGILQFSDRQFPVVQTTDNETYLSTSIYGNYDIFGTPFLDAAIDLDDTENLIIYGHSTYSKDLVFTFLANYVENESWGENNRYFYWIDDTGTYEYSVIAVMKINVDEDDRYWYTINWNSNMEKVAYVMEIINRAEVHYATSFNYTRNYITLVTCTMDDDDERYVAMATYVGKVD